MLVLMEKGRALAADLLSRLAPIPDAVSRAGRCPSLQCVKCMQPAARVRRLFHDAGLQMAMQMPRANPLDAGSNIA